jgi:uncharacterized Tic20 family protein
LGERPPHADEDALARAGKEMPMTYDRDAQALSVRPREQLTMSTADQFASNEERTWCVFTHLSALSMFFIPFGHLVGPLVMWLIKRGEMPMVDRQGKEALNFQLTVTIVSLLCSPLVFIGIGIVVLVLLWIANLILIVVAAVKTSEGVVYRYPLTWRLIG